MKIRDYILKIFGRGDSIIRVPYNGMYPLQLTERLPFAECIFLNICDILTDLCASVKWQRKLGDIGLFAAFVALFDDYGKYILNQIFYRGYSVVGLLPDGRLRVLRDNEYTRNTLTSGAGVSVQPINRAVQCYVLQSDTLALMGKSDREMLLPYLSLLDNVLNGTNTISQRMGAVVFMSPQQVSNAPTSTVLLPQDKDAIETEIGNSYGYLRGQKGVCVLPNAMKIDTINLASLDNKMADRVRVAVLAIADRIKVPANQVAMIDANSSKSLSNGSELREGDMVRYRNFRNLLNRTFWQLAENMGLSVDYTIENDPNYKVL